MSMHLTSRWATSLLGFKFFLMFYIWMKLQWKAYQHYLNIESAFPRRLTKGIEERKRKCKQGITDQAVITSE